MRWLWLCWLLVACTPALPLPSQSRTWEMGFSGVPPRANFEQAVQAILMWSTRADAAIFHIGIPWKALLEGQSPQALLEADQVDLANFYRQKGLTLVVTLDPTDGLNRSAEAPELLAAGRSLSEPAIQALFVQYALAVNQALKPAYLGLAAETNLIRLAAPAAVYNALVAAANQAALAFQNLPNRPKLYVSTQVDTAWGRLQGTYRYEGIAQDFADFPFVEAMGLSSYPYLAGFAQPENIPLDYYSRLLEGRLLPTLLVESGWSSLPGPGFSSSPEVQRRYLLHQTKLAQQAKLVAWFQLTFTDLDLSSWPQPVVGLEPFVHLGLVDANLNPKPALAVWDSVFAWPHTP